LSLFIDLLPRGPDLVCIPVFSVPFLSPFDWWNSVGCTLIGGNTSGKKIITNIGYQSLRVKKEEEEDKIVLFNYRHHLIDIYLA
jgi:hypothetical protein